MTTQQFPDSQKAPLGPNQLAWIDEKFGRAFFRDAKPMVNLSQEGNRNAQA